MIQAELKSLYSTDIPDDIHKYSPDDPDRFGIMIGAFIGPLGGGSEELFYFFVCTPTWLETVIHDDMHIFGKSYLFITTYSYNVIWNAINKLCTSTSGNTWEDVGIKLSRYGDWEFENYRSI